MGLKRKRSESELSGYSLASSPSRPDLAMEATTSSQFWQQPTWSFFSFSRAVTPSHLPSRTFKRFRGNRPSEEEVHQRTLGLLFSAQQQQMREPESARTAPSPVTTPEPQQQGGGAQRSLHSFWKISSAPTSSVASTPSVDQDLLTPESCEDCGGALRSGGGDAMDVDGYGFEARYSCGPCGKKVCGHCSITNLGEQRRCLRCAGKTNRLGTAGWATAQ